MSSLKITQVRSAIDRPKDQKDTVRRLGLHRIGDSIVKEDRPEIRGMIAKVGHLVTVEDVAQSDQAPRPRRAKASSGEAAGRDKKDEA